MALPTYSEKDEERYFPTALKSKKERHEEKTFSRPFHDLPIFLLVWKYFSKEPFHIL